MGRSPGQVLLLVPTCHRCEGGLFAAQKEDLALALIYRLRCGKQALLLPEKGHPGCCGSFAGPTRSGFSDRSSASHTRSTADVLLPAGIVRWPREAAAERMRGRSSTARTHTLQDSSTWLHLACVLNKSHCEAPCVQDGQLTI
jgi:ribosomal protein S27AE